MWSVSAGGGFRGEFRDPLMGLAASNSEDVCAGLRSASTVEPWPPLPSPPPTASLS